MLDNKNIIILGDRDGIPAPAIEQCLAGKELRIVFSATECFV